MTTTIADLKRRNTEAGKHFFSKGALNFFKSRVLPEVYSGRAGREYFVTSEQGPDAPRLYSVRVMHADARVDTLPTFQHFETAGHAKEHARRLAASDRMALKVERAGQNEKLAAIREALWHTGQGKHAKHAKGTRYCPSMHMLFTASSVISAHYTDDAQAAMLSVFGSQEGIDAALASTFGGL